MKKLKVGKYQALCREDTLDEWILNEVTNLQCYFYKLNLTPNDILLDIGMNAGYITLISSGLCKEVIGYEPETDNFNLAKRNMELNKIKNAIIINRAIVGDKTKTRRLFINTKKNRGTHTFVETWGRKIQTVRCDNINTVLKKYSPTKIKMDCEGAEAEIIKGIKSFANVKAIAIEYHRRLLNDKDNIIYDMIISKLGEHFNKLKYPFNAKGWTSMIYGWTT